APAVGRPARGPSRGPQRTGLSGTAKALIIAGVGAGAAALLGVLLLLIFLVAAGGGDNPNVTQENFKKLPAALPPAEGQALLGRGREATQGDIDAVYPGPPGGLGNALLAPVHAWQQYRNGSDRIFVGFGRDSGGERLARAFWVSEGGAAGYYFQMGPLVWGNV